MRIALVGKYLALQDAYLSVVEALCHAGIKNGVKVDIDWVDAEDLTDMASARTKLGQAHAVLIPGGFGPRGMAGMILAAEYAIEHKVPYFGIGLGMQMATVAAARSLAGLADAHSAEAETGCSPLFVLPKGQGSKTSNSSIINMAEKPMRRGAYPCVVQPGTRLAAAYQQETVSERHHHRWEFNLDYQDILTGAGLVLAGWSPDRRTVEAVELAGHPWFVGVIFHPEFKSRPIRPHPLFTAFLTAALEQAGLEHE